MFELSDSEMLGDDDDEEDEEEEDGQRMTFKGRKYGRVKFRFPIRVIR